MQISSRTPGLWPMLYAFFDEAGALRLDALRMQVDVALTAGCAGVSVLGLGTEVSKLTPQERIAVLETVTDALGGRLPLLVTVYGDTSEEQIAFGRRAIDLGAAFLVLQPPASPLEEDALIAFFAEVMDALECPVGLQNAPQFLGYGLSSDAIVGLAERCANFRVAKVECPAVDLARLADELGGKVALFNGRCGLELTDNLRGGAAGLVPGIETADLQAAAIAAFSRGDEAEAERLYARALPAVSFIMQGIPHFLTYGKLTAAHRLGIPVGGQREPYLSATPFGLACVGRHAHALGPLAH